jgi:hypothetical protein
MQLHLKLPFQILVARFLSTYFHASHLRRCYKHVHFSATGWVQPARLPPSYEHWKYLICKRLPAFWSDADETFIVAVFLVGHPVIHNVVPEEHGIARLQRDNDVRVHIMSKHRERRLGIRVFCRYSDAFAYPPCRVPVPRFKRVVATVCAMR